MDAQGPAEPGLGDARPQARRSVRRRNAALGAAACLLLAVIMAASTIAVPANQAALITQFGRPVRVVTTPGLHLKLPIEGVMQIDLRLHITSSDAQNAATRDGQRILVQGYAAWQVGASGADIQNFVTATGHDPADAGSQIRGLINAAIQINAPNFTLSDLVNAKPQEPGLSAFETAIQAQLAAQLRALYGIQIRTAGIERLSLPEPILAATLAQLRTERDRVAAQRTAEAGREAAQIRADAERDSRILIANAQTQAAEIEASARSQAADIYARAYTADPALYTLLRSLDTLGNVIGPNTRLVLRTDAAPFNVLANGPPGDAGGK